MCGTVKSAFAFSPLSLRERARVRGLLIFDIHAGQARWKSVPLECIHQVMEGFTVGIVKPHQNLVRFQHFYPHNFFSLIL